MVCAAFIKQALPRIETVRPICQDHEDEATFTYDATYQRSVVLDK